MDKFLIGQRVLLGDEIGTVCKPEHKNWDSSKELWVFSPSRGYACAFALHNVKPLPNGQL